MGLFNVMVLWSKCVDMVVYQFRELVAAGLSILRHHLSFSTWWDQNLATPCPASWLESFPNGRRGPRCRLMDDATEPNVDRPYSQQPSGKSRAASWEIGVFLPWRVFSIANHSVGAIWLDSAHGKRPQLGNRRHPNSPCPVPTVSGSVCAPLPPLHPATSSLAGLFGQTSSMRCPFQVPPRDPRRECARLPVCCRHRSYFQPHDSYVWRVAGVAGESTPALSQTTLGVPGPWGKGLGPEDDEGSPGAVVRHCKLHQLGIRNQRTGNGQLIDQ